MNIQTIKISLRKLQEILGLRFYCHPQAYKIQWDISVRNTSQKKLTYSLIVPYFTNTINQTITNVKISDKNYKQGKEKQYNNEYIWWHQNIHAESTQTFAYTFDAKISPVEIRKDAINRVSTAVHTINEHLIKNLIYGNPIEGLYTAKQAKNNPKTDCGGYTMLFLEMCKNKNIQGNIIAGFWLGHPELKHTMHAWGEIMQNKNTIPFDTSSEQLFRQGRLWCSGKLGFVGSDRIIASKGNNLTLDIENQTIHTDILQNPIIISNDKQSLQIKHNFQSHRTDEALPRL